MLLSMRRQHELLPEKTSTLVEKVVNQAEPLINRAFLVAE
jgi:hypothetical protein